jgi:hypothetical protein
MNGQELKRIKENKEIEEEERVERVVKLLRHVLRMKLKIPCCKVYYVKGWGWL